MTKVGFISLGGTISMEQSAQGQIPKLGASSLLQTLPQFSDIEVITYQTPMLPGASLDLELIHSMAQLINSALEKVDAIVLAQGTDTIEETAFLLSLLTRSDKPIVVTGAMRGADAVSSDGPANLLNAFLIASAKSARHVGVVVALNEEIHSPYFVAKTHTSSLGAFESYEVGPIGFISEGVVTITSLPCLPGFPNLSSIERAFPAVGLIKASLGEDARLLESAAALGYEGLVIEATGAGHLSEKWVKPVADLAQKMPVVLATRVPKGKVHTQTYGFPGSERDLLRHGLLPAGYLCPLKARLLLIVLLAQNKNREEIKHMFYQVY